MSILIFILTMAALITIGVICYQVLMEPDESIYDREGGPNEIIEGREEQGRGDELLR